MDLLEAILTTWVPIVTAIVLTIINVRKSFSATRKTAAEINGLHAETTKTNIATLRDAADEIAELRAENAALRRECTCGAAER